MYQIKKIIVMRKCMFLEIMKYIHKVANQKILV